MKFIDSGGQPVDAFRFGHDTMETWAMKHILLPQQGKPLTLRTVDNTVVPIHPGDWVVGTPDGCTACDHEVFSTRFKRAS